MGIVNNNELNTKVMGNKIIHFNTIESTNDYAKSIGYEEKEGTVIISETQTKGRGRLGRKWSSKQGEGIYMSIILKPNIELNKTIFDNVNFTKSEIEEMSLKGIDLSTCKINNIKISPKALKGVIIDQFQALDLIRLLEVEIKE